MQFRGWVIAVGSLAVFACGAPEGAGPRTPTRAVTAALSASSCETACGPGIQKGSQCVPEVAPLKPAWTYQPAAHRQLAFNGLVDPEGNAFWIELDGRAEAVHPELPELVSAGVRGQLRFRKVLGADGKFAPPIVARSAVIVADRDRIEARRRTDGEIAWSASLETLFDGAGLAPMAWRPQLTTNGDGAVVLIGSSPSRDGRTRSLVVAFDEQTGKVRWKRAYEGRAAGLVSDGTARVFFSLHGGGAGRQVLALGSRGEERWRTASGPLEAPAAVVSGALVLANGHALGLNDGAAKWTLPPAFTGPEARASLIGGRSGGFFVSPPCSGPGCTTPAPAQLHRLGPNGTLDWSREAGTYASTALGPDGELLAIDARPDASAALISCLRRWSARGDTSLSVALPGNAPYVAPSPIVAGRVIAATQTNFGARGETPRFRLVGFEVPPTAADAWVSRPAATVPQAPPG